MEGLILMMEYVFTSEFVFPETSSKVLIEAASIEFSIIWKNDFVTDVSPSVPKTGMSPITPYP